MIIILYQGRQDHQATPELLAPRDTGVRQDVTDLLDITDHAVQLDRLDCQDPLPQDHAVYQDQQDLLDYADISVYRVTPV